MIKQIIIVYENIVREYDNALLLKAEFERRGFQVYLAYKTETILFIKRSSIILVPNCYNTDNYDFYQYTLNSNGNPIISLQYEQVLSKRIEKTGMHNPKGKAKNIYFFCWGKNCFDRLCKYGIEEKRIKICGALQLDFLRPEFSGFYLTRKELADQYKLDCEKKWLLYISSFSYVDNSIITKYTAEELADDIFIKDFTELSVRSQEKTLNWFEQLIIENPDITIIYRKHPVEAGNRRIEELTKQYPFNFKNIDDLSVKQWVSVCDIIVTWFSTSIAEVYMAKKPLLLLRPYPIKEEYDVPFYYRADCIDSYEKLGYAINNIEQFSIPVSIEILNGYYSLKEKPAFLRIADEVEKIASAYTKQQKIDVKFVLYRLRFFLKKGRLIKFILKSIYQTLFIHFNFKLRNERIRNAYCVNDWEKSAKHKNDTLNKEKYQILKEIVNEYRKSI